MCPDGLGGGEIVSHSLSLSGQDATLVGMESEMEVMESKPSASLDFFYMVQWHLLCDRVWFDSQGDLSHHELLLFPGMMVPCHTEDKSPGA